MTAEERVRDGLDAFNKGDRERYVSFWADDGVYTEAATGREAQGVEAIGEMVFGWRVPFPDLVGDIEHIYGCGDEVTAEVRWHGTHTGPLMTPDGQTIPPTSRSLDNMGCLVLTLKDGKVVSQRHYFDLATMMIQLGLMAGAEAA